MTSNAPVPNQLSNQGSANTAGTPSASPPMTPPGSQVPPPGAPVPPSSAPAQPPRKGFAWQSIAIRVGVIAVIVIGALVLRDRLSGAAGDLKVGDCFDEPADITATVHDVQHHPCNESHDAEVIFVGDYTGATTYPSDADFETFVTDKCVPVFGSYTGLDFNNAGDFNLGWFSPTPDGWTGGDHEVSCFIDRLDGAKLTKSVKAGT